MAWQITLSKVEVIEQEYMLYSDHMDALAAAVEMEDFLGILDAPEVCIIAKRSPVTGELLVVKMEVSNDEERCDRTVDEVL